MNNPITLFTGQWADMTIEDISAFAKSAGFDGLELACWGKHLEVQNALGSDGASYIEHILDAFDKNDIGVWSLGAHLVGQALTDQYATDPDLLALLPAHIRAGNPEQVRQNAAKEMMDTARVAEKIRDVAEKKYGERGKEMWNPTVVTGFTGSPLWHRAYAFAPYITDGDAVEHAFQEVVRRMHPVLDVFEKTGTKFALEVHPTEIAFDGVTALRLHKVIGRSSFGFNNDPSHLLYQGVDPVKYVKAIAEVGALHHSHIKDVTYGGGDGLAGVFGSHLAFGDEGRYWDFRSVGRGRVDTSAVIKTMISLGYTGPLSIEWEDANMKREAGATASQLVTRGLRDYNSAIAQKGYNMYKDPSNFQTGAFDNVFAQK